MQVSSGPLRIDHVHPGPSRPRRRVESVQRPRRRDGRAGQPLRCARVLAAACIRSTSAHREAVGRLHGRRGARRGHATRAGAHRHPSSTATRSTCGGRRFELLLHTRRRDHRRARGLDAGTRTVFIGNLMGPFFGHVPNLYTLRGGQDSQRDGVHPLRRPGDRARAGNTASTATTCSAAPTRSGTRMTKGPRRDGIPARPHHRQGMNAGSDLWTLMQRRDAAAGAGAAPGARQGAVDRAGHLGGARPAGSATRSTTELYDVPPPIGVVGHRRTSSAAQRTLTDRAQTTTPRPAVALQALHLTDIVLAHAPA